METDCLELERVLRRLINKIVLTMALRWFRLKSKVLIVICNGSPYTDADHIKDVRERRKYRYAFLRHMSLRTKLKGHSLMLFYSKPRKDDIFCKRALYRVCFLRKSGWTAMLVEKQASAMYKGTGIRHGLSALRKPELPESLFERREVKSYLQTHVHSASEEKKENARNQTHHPAVKENLE